MTAARAGALALAFLLAACGGGAPPAPRYAPLRYDYLTRIKLDVARIDIDDTWTPRGADRHVEFLSPTAPLDALRQMADDRLVPGGTKRSARFTIEDASIIRAQGNYQADFAARLDILDDNGKRLRGIEAHASGAHAVTGDDPATVRADLYALTRKTMDDMNVDFEYRIRRDLRADLQTTSPNAPPPAPVSTEELGTPADQQQP